MSTSQKPHNLLKKIDKMYRDHPDRFPPGSLGTAEIQHDDWCGIFNGKRCNCDPNIITQVHAFQPHSR